MNTVAEIERAIERLPRKEMFQLVERLENKVDDTWDEQFEGDAASGRLDDAAAKALKEHREGKSTPFPDDAK